MKYKVNKLLGFVLRHIALIIFSVVSLFPIVYVVCSSFKSNREFLEGGAKILPTIWHYENYITVWNNMNFAHYTFNSVYTSIMSVVLVLLVSSIMGYCLSRGKFKGKKIIMGAYLGTMFVAGGMTIYPIFEMFVKAGLNTTINGLVLIRLGSQATNAFLVMGSLQSIPTTIDEAARIDGCTFWRRYWNIILPLLKPILATIAILTFTAVWNEYMMAMAFTLSNDSLRTLTVAVVALRNELGGLSLSPYNLIFAGTAISIVPMIIIFIFMNNRIIEGMTSGAVKG